MVVVCGFVQCFAEYALPYDYLWLWSVVLCSVLQCVLCLIYGSGLMQCFAVDALPYDYYGL